MSPGAIYSIFNAQLRCVISPLSNKMFEHLPSALQLLGNCLCQNLHRSSSAVAIKINPVTIFYMQRHAVPMTLHNSQILVVEPATFDCSSRMMVVFWNFYTKACIHLS